MTTQNCLLVHGHSVKPDEQLVSFGRPALDCIVEKEVTKAESFYLKAYHEGY